MKRKIMSVLEKISGVLGPAMTATLVGLVTAVSVVLMTFGLIAGLKEIRTAMAEPEPVCHGTQYPGSSVCWGTWSTE